MKIVCRNINGLQASTFLFSAICDRTLMLPGNTTTHENGIDKATVIGDQGRALVPRRSLPEVDQRYEQQKFMADPEARKKTVWEMDKSVRHDSASLILHWFDMYHARWNLVKGWMATPNIRSTNARIDNIWLDPPELPHAR